MIELPAQNRGFFCTKCGSDVCKPETITQPHPPCAKCGYLGFAADRGYTADQLRTYGDQRAAEARKELIASLNVRADGAITGDNLVLLPRSDALQSLELDSTLVGCACRWDSEDIRVRTCERHQGWLDVVVEWSDRAKEAEKHLQSLITQAQMDRAFPVAHSRKYAEPVAWLYKDESTFDGNKWNENYTSTTSKQVALFKDKNATPLFTHPPEADKLLQQALEALNYHTEQTRPILQTDAARLAIRTYLDGLMGSGTKNFRSMVMVVNRSSTCAAQARDSR